MSDSLKPRIRQELPLLHVVILIIFGGEKKVKVSPFDSPFRDKKKEIKQVARAVIAFVGGRHLRWRKEEAKEEK